MIIRNDPTKEKFIKQLSKLNAEEFLGVATILKVNLFEDVERSNAATSSVLGQAIQKAKEETPAVNVDSNEEKNVEDTSKATDRQMRPFEEVVADMLANYCALNRTQRRNLFGLVKTATKKR